MQLLGILCLAVSSVVFGQTYTISTFAGGGPANNIPATSVPLNHAKGVASDAAGNLFITTNDSVFRLDASTNTVTKILGTGAGAIAVDPSGNVYVAAGPGIEKISNGIVTTVAGNGTPGVLVDNGPAIKGWFLGISGLAVDAAGNLYIADSGTNRVRKVSNGVITTIAGSGTCVLQGMSGFVSWVCAGGFSGDNGPATGAQLSNPSGVAIDGAGNVYVADGGNHRVREVSNGLITTIAGGGTNLGDNIPAISAQLAPTAVAVDAAGHLYIAESPNARVRRISNEIVTTVAGTGTRGFSGDSGLATAAQLSNISGVALDAAGNLYIADDIRIRKVANGIITTVAGNGWLTFGGDGGPANGALLATPLGVAADAAGNVYIADRDNHRIRKVSNGVITTVAGNGTGGFGGDGGPATSAWLNYPSAVAVDSSGNLYIFDSLNYRVREVSNGVITTVAGNGTQGFSADNIPATSAAISAAAIAVDPTGTLYFSESAYNSNQSDIRKVSNGVLATVPGTESQGLFGAIPVLNQPGAIAFDSAGGLYVIDIGHVSKVANGVLTKLVGNGGVTYGGDGGPAIDASGEFGALAIDSAGTLYISDGFLNSNDVPVTRIRKVSNGVINTIAGNGTNGFSGDNGPALAAQFAGVNGLAVDSAGKVYVADWGNNRIRVLTPPPFFPAQNSASYAAGSLAPDTVAITQISGIAAAPITAPNGAWPTTLGGVSLQITDSQNVAQLAPIGSVSPNSLTYLIPATTALGLASVQLTTSTGAIIAGQLQINRIAPGLFSANSSGSGVAAGMWMLDVALENSQTSGYLFDPTLPVGQRYAIGFDPGPESDQVFLSLYGTGFHNANLVTATVGGASVPVTGIAPVASSAGEDVVTIGPLPRSLEGANIPIVLTFDGQLANTVTFSMRPTRSRPTARGVH